jgi:hypothetical protein
VRDSNAYRGIGAVAVPRHLASPDRRIPCLRSYARISSTIRKRLVAGKASEVRCEVLLHIPGTRL